MRQNTTSETSASDRPVWMLRFTAAAAMILLVASPASAQLGGLGLPDVAVPETPAVPDSPVSASADAGADTPVGSASAHADENGARACAQASASSQDVHDAVSQAKGQAGAATGAAGAVTGPATAMTGGLPAAPEADLPSIDASASAEACADADAAGALADAQSQAEEAKGQAGGLLGKIQGLASKIGSFFSF